MNYIGLLSRCPAVFASESSTCSTVSQVWEERAVKAGLIHHLAEVQNDKPDMPPRPDHWCEEGAHCNSLRAVIRPSE